MIAREWRCICPADNIEEFIPYLSLTGIKDAKNTPGFKGAEIFKKDAGNSVEVTVITCWESMDSVRIFAGENIDKAVLYPQDYKYGISSEPVVKHYTVADRF